MQTRTLGPFTVSAIGLGCMNLSHAYGHPVEEAEATRLLLRALDCGVDFLDTAALYGFGANESLLGRALKGHRQRFVLASKCGMTGVNGKRVIDGRAATIKATCDAALQRLQTDVIDLYYLHRLDFAVPIEESVGALADLVQAGKIRGIGLSEVSALTLRRAHAVHPVTALQSEYSLWSREPEIAALEACRELGVAFVAFSPLARGFLGGHLINPHKQLEAGDIRLSMPRFEPDNYVRNLQLLPAFRSLAAELGGTPAQLALAWLLASKPEMLMIPGTRSIAHLEENLGAYRLKLDEATVTQLDSMIHPRHIAGERYNEATFAEIDSERFNTLD